MIIPTLESGSTSRVVTDTFRGYNHNMKISDGEWYDTKNLTTAYAPMLSPRGKRGVVRTMTEPGGMIEKDALYYVDNGTLYKNSLATGLTGLSTAADKKVKQLVSFGAYIIIMPDKKYYNTVTGEYGSMEAHYSYTGTVKYEMCHVDGSLYTSVVIQDDEPADNVNAEAWIQTVSGSSSFTVKVKSDTGWVELNTVYTKITFTTTGAVPAAFSEMDAVTIAGCTYGGCNGSKLIYAMGGKAAVGTAQAEQDWIVVINQLPVQQISVENQTVTIDRTVPTMNYLCESQNRLWGCFYGSVNGTTLNEIYCSALGDFKVWNRFAGVSTDSWVGSVGSDGEWTGCINYLGSPTFFKENHIHVIGVSSSGAHQISETPCRGVQKGSHKSLRIVNEVLYYKSRSDVCAYQGSFPQGISEALGEMSYGEAAAGVIGERYYISLKHGDDRNLFVYDTGTGLWMREDELPVVDLCRVDDELYAIDSDKKLYALRGSAGTPETQVEWYAESGILYYEYTDHKYLSRYNIRMKGERGSRMDIYIQYDSEGPWVHSGTVRQTGTNTVTIPVRPRRCDHMRLRLVGKGDIKIYSISKILEVGSDA